MDNNIWTNPIINLLERIKYNSVLLYNKHRRKYVKLNTTSKFFDLPIIVLSVFSASFTSLNAIDSNYAVIITTSISMIITILSSTKLYLNLTSNINSEIDLSKAYYILSINIFKMLILRPNDVNAMSFLDASFSEYSKLIESSSLLYKNIKKDLLTIDYYFKDSKINDNLTDNSSHYSTNSDSPRINILLKNDFNEI